SSLFSPDPRGAIPSPMYAAEAIDKKNVVKSILTLSFCSEGLMPSDLPLPKEGDKIDLSSETRPAMGKPPNGWPRQAVGEERSDGTPLRVFSVFLPERRDLPKSAKNKGDREELPSKSKSRLSRTH